MRKLRAELDYYSLSVIVLCQMCRNRKKKNSHLSGFCQECRHSVSDRSNDFGASWMSLIHTALSQTSEPFRLTVVFLIKKQNFSSEETKYSEVESAPGDCSQDWLTQIGKQFPPGVCFVLCNRPGCDKLGVDCIFLNGALILVALLWG